jgi:hypothetical protein
MPRQTVEADTAKAGVAGRAKTPADCVTSVLIHVGALVYVCAERAVTVFIPVAVLAKVTVLLYTTPPPAETHVSDPE